MVGKKGEAAGREGAELACDVVVGGGGTSEY